MKLLDRYKLSLHNIKNNKSRSILTTIIVYIISLLIMAILCIGISFSNDMSKLIRTYYEKSNEPIVVRYMNYISENDIFDNSVYKNVVPIIESNSSIISYATYSSNYGSSVLINDYRYPVGEYIEIVEGRAANKEDVGSNKVLVSASYANQYYSTYGTILKPGVNFTDTVNYHVKNNQGYISKDAILEFEVVGVFKIDENIINEEGVEFISIGTNIITDAQFLFDNISDFSINEASFYFNAPQTNFNATELEEKLDVFVEALKGVVPLDSDGYGVNCNALADLSMSNLIGIIIIGFATFLCLILILLSIGSLANTIMISVDKNKKFIGLLKALGLDEGDLKSTIKMESITTIVAGISLSFITLCIFKNLFAKLNALLVNSMFSNYVKAINYVPTFALPIYVPIIVLIFFVAFTLLFAKGSMSKIAKTDPMAVISEVA